MDDEEERADFPGFKPLDHDIDKTRWPWNTNGMAANYAKINFRLRMKGLYPIGTRRRPKSEEPPVRPPETDDDEI